MTSLWVLVLSRFLICMCAGEVAIRYTAWAYLFRHTRPFPTAAPLVVGVAIWAAGRFGVEFRWMLQIADPSNHDKILSLVEGDLASELLRLVIIFALCFLVYPVTKLQYRHSWERAVVEMAVRIFLVSISIMIGWTLCIVNLTH